MRIGIDARFWSEQGHGRYIRNLIKEVQAIDTTNDYIVFLRQADFEKITFTNPKFEKKIADVRWYTLKEQLVLPWIFYKAKLDILHVPHFNVPILYPGKFVLTMHDLTITHFPTIRATTLPKPIWKLKRFFYHAVLSLALRRAKHMIAVSDFTKHEVQKYYPFIKDTKITVTPEAVEEAFIQKGKAMTPSDASITAVKAKYGITKQYLPYIGNVHPHKNIDRLVRVFHQVQQDLAGNVQLVLVGKDDYFQKQLRAEIEADTIGANIIWTGFVADDELIPLMKGAAAFVFPSLMEGFGIPPLEAMACGTPTIVSKNASLPEVCGDASYYFDPTNEAEMQQKIKEVLENADVRLSLIQKGYERIKQFSWKTMAEQTLQTYSLVTKK